MNKVINVSVVIPTLGTKNRAPSLLKCIQTIFIQSNVKAIPIVVVNGNEYDSELFSWLNSNASIKLIQTESKGLPNAIHMGRCAVDTKYFSFLDDDDQYTIDALEKRARPMEKDHDIDAVISNGYRRLLCSSTLNAIFRTFPTNNINFLSALIRENWLASCGGTFRTETVDPSYFENLPCYYEWTTLASRLATAKQLYFLDEKTFIVNQTENSLSQSINCLLQGPVFLTRFMSEINFSNHDQHLLKGRLTSAYNQLANHYLEKKKYKASLYYYFKCVFSTKYGPSYIPWIRHFLRRPLRR